MVGRLNLPNLCDTDPLGMSCRAERVLDSPDSGLPPSPSPSAWLLPLSTDKGGMSPVSEDEGRDLCIMVCIALQLDGHICKVVISRMLALCPR